MTNQKHTNDNEAILARYAELFISRFKSVDLKEALQQLEKRSGPIYDQYVKFAFEIKVDGDPT